MADTFVSIPINQEWTSEIVVNKSRFLGFARFVETEGDALKFIEQKRKQFSDARHVCFAYVVGSTMRFSDDGEPSGTAGKPILDILVKQNIKNAVLVVVRYFGGVKLGAGPLLRTYSNSAKETLNGTLALWEKAKQLTAIVSFKEYQQIMGQSEKTKIEILGVDFSDNVKLSVVIPFDFDFKFGTVNETKDIYYSFKGEKWQ